jgi:hypothetical protein
VVSRTGEGPSDVSTAPPYARFERVYDVLHEELFDAAAEVAAIHTR